MTMIFHFLSWGKNIIASNIDLFPSGENIIVSNIHLSCVGRSIIPSNIYPFHWVRYSIVKYSLLFMGSEC